MEGFDLLLDVEGVRRAIGWVGGRRRGRRREMDGDAAGVTPRRQRKEATAGRSTRSHRAWRSSAAAMENCFLVSCGGLRDTSS